MLGMDVNPYKSPEAENEPARPRAVRTAAKSGAWIGALMMIVPYAIAAPFVFIANLAGAIPLDDLHLGKALAGILAGSLAGSAVGAAFGALFQAIANAALRRAAKKTPSSE